MAKQKKIDISLTVAEAQHVQRALDAANAEHGKMLGRPNQALIRALSKIDKAQALADSVDLEPVKDANADATE